jgi:hypothetical protein
VLLQTRWTMNFLAGPLARTQIRDLNKLVNADSTRRVVPKPVSSSLKSSVSANPVPNLESFQPISSASATSTPELSFASKPNVARPSREGSLQSPLTMTGIREYFLPQNYSMSEAFSSTQRAMPMEAMIKGVTYKPVLLATAQVRLLDRKYGVDMEITRAVLVDTFERRDIVRWDDFSYRGPSLDKVETEPFASARFGSIASPLNEPKLMAALQKDFIDWILRNSAVTARANSALKVYGGPDVSQADFMKACADTARDAADAEKSKKTSVIAKKIKTLEDKLGREERELRQDQSDLQNRNLESGANMLELGASLFGLGRKKSVATQITKHRLAQNARADVEESVETIEQYKKDLSALLRERDEVTAEINDRWGHVVNDISEVSIKPKKTDIYVNLFGVAWKPFYVVQAGDETIELSAFGAE